MSLDDRCRVYEWFSYSQWGMFLLPLFTAPDWFVNGLDDLDDEQIEELEHG